MDKAPDLEYQTCRREELTKAARDSLAEASLDTSRPSGFLFQNEEKLSLDKTTPGQQVLIIHALTSNPFSLEVFASALGEAAPSWKKVRNSTLHLTNIYRVVAVPTPILLPWKWFHPKFRYATMNADSTIYVWEHCPKYDAPGFWSCSTGIRNIVSRELFFLNLSNINPETSLTERPNGNSQ